MIDPECIERGHRADLVDVGAEQADRVDREHDEGRVALLERDRACLDIGVGRERGASPAEQPHAIELVVAVEIRERLVRVVFLIVVLVGVRLVADRRPRTLADADLEHAVTGRRTIGIARAHHVGGVEAFEPRVDAGIRRRVAAATPDATDDDGEPHADQRCPHGRRRTAGPR